MTNQNNPPNCNMHEALVSQLYDEASTDERRRVEAHLKECNVCAEELKAFERVRGMLQQWQVDELPEVRIVTRDRADGNRSMLVLIKELFTASPIWAKALGAAAVAMIIFAVMGTSIGIGRNGFTMTVSMFDRGAAQPGNTNGSGGQVDVSEVRAMVISMIAESERQQSDALRKQLVSLESQLQNAHEADLAKVASRLQQQRELLKTLERDIDRREGLALSDILFADATRSGAQGSD